MVNDGEVTGSSASGWVKAIWRRTAETGIDTPSMFPIRRDHAPAAQTTVLVLMRPCSVITSVIVPPLLTMSVTSQYRTILAPGRRAAAAYPITTDSGVALPSPGDQHAPTRPS